MRNFLPAPFSFKGRIGRKRYWALTLLYTFALLVGMGLFVTLGIVLNAGSNDAITFVLVAIAIVFLLTMSVAIAAIGVRRLHDRGKVGYWLLLYYAVPSWLSNHAGLDAVGLRIAAAALGVFLWGLGDLGMLHGEAGSNAFGPDPLADDPAPQPAN